MKVGIELGGVNKFGISWCIPHRMAVDNAHGLRTPNDLKAKIKEI